MYATLNDAYKTIGSVNIPILPILSGIFASKSYDPSLYILHYWESPLIGFQYRVKANQKACLEITCAMKLEIKVVWCDEENLSEEKKLSEEPIEI